MQYLQSKNNYEALVKNQNALQNQYNKFQIRAPFSGTIDMVQTKVGEMLAPGMPALRIINLENLEIKAEVSEKYVGKFSVNDNATVLLTGINDTLKAKVSSISQVINNNNRTFIMILKPLNKASMLKPNLLAIVQIKDFNAKNAISVPAAVVQSKNNKQYLTQAIQENNVWKAKVVPIETGPVQSGRVLVQSGIDAGDYIITNGYLNVLDGDKINPIK
jgi:RND family efflux transporter MFP subunit